MSDDLNDSIDYSEFEQQASPEDALNMIPVSSEILDSLESSSSMDELDASVESPAAINKAQAALTTFEKLQSQMSTQIGNATVESLFPTLEKRQEYLKSVTMRLYDEIAKQAKLYLREWCKVNGYSQKWSNPFLRHFNRKDLSHMSEFVPQVYTLSVVKKPDFSESPNEATITQTLADMQFTPREASIQGAKRLGFDDSTRRVNAFSKFSKNAVEIILANPKYISEAKAIYTYEEHRRQIESRSYIPLSIKAKWLKALDEKNVFKTGQF